MDDKDISIICLTVIALSIVITSAIFGKTNDYLTILAGIVGAIAGIATGKKKND